MNNRILYLLAAAAGLSGIALGAVGAHGLKEQLLQNGYYDTWATAADYHMIHAVALFVLAVWKNQSHESLAYYIAGGFWTLGIALFSGALYMLSTGAPKFFGSITPVGGLCFMFGWITIGVIAMRDSKEEQRQPEPSQN